MATVSIPWNDGNGNILLTFTGQENETVTVTSDTDNLGYDRQQDITFYVTDGAIRLMLGTASGHQLVTSDGHALTCLDRSMKVTVTVIQPTGMRVLLTSEDHKLITTDGHELWAHPSE